MEVLFSLLLIILIFVLRLSSNNPIVDINPILIETDKSILQLREANVNLETLINAKNIELTSLNNDIQNLIIEKSNQEYLLELAIEKASSQNINTPTQPTDPELVLIVNLRTDILSYMNSNFVPLTTYTKGSVFYIGLDNIILSYLLATTLTISEFNTQYPESRTIAFRQAIQDIYDNTLPITFDTFYNNISNP